MVKIERLYTIPLRKEFNKVPNYRKTRKAVIAIRNFMKKHMKCENIKIGSHLNLELWKHGRKNPPPRIKVKAIKDTEKIKDKEIEIVRVELPNIPIEKIKADKKQKLEDKVETKSKEEAQKVVLESEKKEVLEKGTTEKERKVLQESQSKPEDITKHKKTATKQAQKKLREQKMIPGER